MVFFTCNACGEALKKNKVDKHLSQCRTTSLSCMDCGKDFVGNAFNSHNECVSEDQKYGGMDFKAKDSSQKGKLKQEIWIQKVKDAINKSEPNQHINDLMQRLLGFDNIPRKKQKFFNFVKNCLKVRNDYYIQQMWDIFETATKEDVKLNGKDSVNANKDNNYSIDGNKRELSESETNDSNVSKKCKQTPDKCELESDGIQNSSHISIETKKLKINKIITQILKNRQNNEMSLKKLRKKVLKVFKSNGNHYSEEEFTLKFDSKINKHKKITLNDGKVKLI